MNDDLIRRSDAIEAIHREARLAGGSVAIEYADMFQYAIKDIPSADRPQGYWTKTDVATYRCSECGKIQIADDVNELNFCCCCGSRNKVRRKGVDNE